MKYVEDNCAKLWCSQKNLPTPWLVLSLVATMVKQAHRLLRKKYVVVNLIITNFYLLLLLYKSLDTAREW